MKPTNHSNKTALRFLGFFGLILVAIVIWPVTIGLFCVWVMATLAYGAGKASRHRIF